MKNAKESAEEEVKKENARANKAMQAVKVLQKSLEMAKAAEEEIKNAYKILSKDKVELEARVDTLEENAKMSEDLLARE